MKRILLDGRFIGVGESITRYTLEILRGVLALDQENEYTILVRPLAQPQISKFKSQNDNPNLKINYLDIPHYSLAEQTKLLNYLNSEKFDLVHFPQFNHPIRYRGKFVVTIHDLTMVGYLHRANIVKKSAFGYVMKSAVKNSAKIITVSRAAKADIIDYYHPDPGKIEVIYNGVDHGHYNETVRRQMSDVRRFKERYNIKGEYVLYTGMWKRHKNLIRLLKAYEIFVNSQQPAVHQSAVGSGKLQTADRMQQTETLPTADCQLVLAGKIDKDEPEVVAEIERINSGLSSVVGRRSTIVDYKKPIEDFPTNDLRQTTSDKRVIATGYIEEPDLPIAYAGALAYVIPSLSEGFGLPPLEAMACGTPVISSNVSSMPEIMGEAALYFDPYDVDDIAKAIKKIVGDKELREELSKKGLRQAKKYSWNKSAKETLEVYKSILAVK